MKYSVRNNCSIELFELPLWSVAIGPDEEKGEKSGTAKGLIAIGDSATGIVAVGYLAKGIVSVGVVSIGLFSVGVLNFCFAGVGFFTIGAVLAKGILAAALYKTSGLIAAGYEATGTLTFSLDAFF